jgi:hypothetical protein
MWARLLATGLRMGLSARDLALLTVDDVDVLATEWAGPRASKGKRKATQADLDRLFPV